MGFLNLGVHGVGVDIIFFGVWGLEIFLMMYDYFIEFNFFFFFINVFIILINKHLYGNEKE